MIGETILHFAEYELQIIALSWLVILYVIKIAQISKLPMVGEIAPRKGKSIPGVLRSYATIFTPWSMESSRRHLWRWMELGIFHVGAGIAILNTFLLPFAPGFMTQPVRIAFSIIIASAIPLGLVKLIRRVARPEMHIINTPDDFFSLVALEFFFVAAVIVLLVNTPFWRMTYFLITAGFLFYVPFSKISHYIYFFIAGFITGSRYGWRGVIPQLKRAE